MTRTFSRASASCHPWRRLDGAARLLQPPGHPAGLPDGQVSSQPQRGVFPRGTARRAHRARHASLARRGGVTENARETATVGSGTFRRCLFRVSRAAWRRAVEEHSMRRPRPMATDIPPPSPSWRLHGGIDLDALGTAWSQAVRLNRCLEDAT